jgi:hypothetical protein
MVVAAFKVVLYSCTRQPAIRVTTDFANRPAAEWTNVYGLFSNRRLFSACRAKGIVDKLEAVLGKAIQTPDISLEELARAEFPAATAVDAARP